jgi:TonB-dependent starch-binding outer membrane protein SusC
MKRGILLLSAFTSWRCPTRLHATLLLAMLISSPFLAFAQLDVKGTVTDESGIGMPGVNVVLKGTTKGTTTDSNGSYAVSAPSDAVLVFSFVGYDTKEILVGQQSKIDIQLSPNIASLAEVVVIGYGVQRQEAVTGSVASINSNAIREVPASNFTQALQGRLAGVDMQQTSSRPGAAMQIRIRGTRSLTASNDPLIVLDGIPFAGSISDINPNDIKSIDVLKDASATAIYGSRGANGVILVTTNSGKKGQKTQFSYNGYYGVKDLFARYPMMNGAEFSALRKAANQYQNTLDESDDVNTDWQDMIFDTGVMQSHDVSAAGGTEKGTFSFNIGYFADGGVVPLQDYERFSMRGSLDQEIGRYFRVGFTTNNNYSISNGNGVPAVGMALARSPLANPYQTDGTLKPTILEQTSGAQWTPTRERFENLGDGYIDQTKAYGSYNTIFAEAKIPGVEGLKYRVNLGLSYRQANSGSYTGQGVFSGNPTTVSNASISNELTTNWAIENLLTYDRTFADKHNLNVVALYSAQENFYNRSNVTARDIPADHFQFYNLGQASGEIKVDPGQQWYNKSGLVSWMGRVMYSFDDRIMLSATFRSDASSRLAPGHQWHSYPAISAGWNLKRESFMENVGFVNMLKLRVGYGETSNQSVDPYKTLGLLSTRPYNFGDQYATGTYVSELPNPALGWEFSRTTNYGVDFALLNNRLTGTIEYYSQQTKDLLYRVNLPVTSGVNAVTQNVGESQNKGIELTLNGTILDNVNGWTWDLGFNLYANRNELVALASGMQRDESNWWFVGNPIDVIYDYERTGLWQEEDPYRDILEPGGNAGMIKVKYTGDYNPDGTPTRAIGSADRQILSLQPKFQGGFNTSVSYKGFDLGIVGAFKSGGILISTLYGSTGYLNTMNGRAGNNVKIDYWTPENTDAKYPKPGGIQTSDNPKYGSTLGYFDASFLKIRTISLGYDFKQPWVKNSGLEKLRVYATVQNPFVAFSPYHKESGMDPEPNSYGNENVAVGGIRRLLIVGTNTPTTRNYMLGVNLTF